MVKENDSNQTMDTGKEIYRYENMASLLSFRLNKLKT
jgi:hypothetical protein